MSRTVRIFVVAGLLVGLGLALLAAPFASSSPDGLEKVATEEGFADAADGHDLADGPLADYGPAGVGDRAGTAIAGVVGLVVTFGVALGLFGLVRALRRRSGSPTPPRAPT